jgi:phosphoserine aminotransferase
MTAIFNFSAGPAVLPKEVLTQAAQEMLDWHGSGMSVMEMSHRGKEFSQIMGEALADFRELLGVPANYKILFMQGGAIAQNALIPMNLLGNAGEANFVVSGAWSAKSYKEAARYGKVHLAAGALNGPYIAVSPALTWQLSDAPAYLHLCTNETIDGVEMFDVPSQATMAALGHPDVPVVSDMSSHILSRAMDISEHGVIFGGAQKNIGPAGLTFVIVRDDLLGRAMPCCPGAFDFKTVADNDSMYNTPPTYAIYIAGLVFKWLKAQGGVAAIEAHNKVKADLLYACIDASDFYVNRVAPANRSRMNIPFFLHDESLNAAFLSQSQAAGLLQLKGHKSVGGMRASIYNAMPLVGVQALVDFMKEFERVHG